MKKKLIFCLCLLSLFSACGCGEPPQTSGMANQPVKPQNPPLQTQYKGSSVFSRTFEGGSCLIKPLYEYRVEARVVGKKKYSSGWEARIAPYDLALAWEDLSLEENLRQVSFSQSGRWYYFRLRSGARFGLDFVYKQSSNNHIIPHTENILRAMKSLKKGDAVLLSGYLVRIDGTYNGRPVWWKSSTSRGDTGDGSCEIIYVTKLQAGNNIYN